MAGPSQYSYGMDMPLPIATDYTQFQLPDANSLQFGSSVGGSSMGATGSNYTTGIGTPAYASPIGAGSNAAGKATFNVADNTGNNAGAGAGDPSWFNKNLENGNFKDIAGILQGFGTLWGGFQQNKIAKDALKFQKQSYETNLSNSIKSYNTALTDRMTSRGAQNETSSAAVQDQIATNRL
jgi:hypothetical protein